MRPVAWVVLLSGCAKNTDGDGNGTDDPNDAEPAFTIAAEADCEALTDDNTGEEVPLPGATRFWIAELGYSGDTVEGYESKVLFANAEWRAADPEVAFDCEVRWTATGTKGEARACGACEYGLVLNLIRDDAATTCAAAYADSEPQYYDVEYDVDVAEDGTATFLFSSGNDLGTGGSNDQFAWYQSPPACEWY